MRLDNTLVLAGLLAESRQSAERSRTQLGESQQREKVLVRRLAAKEQEMQDYVVSSHRKSAQVQMFSCFLLGFAF